MSSSSHSRGARFLKEASLEFWPGMILYGLGAAPLKFSSTLLSSWSRLFSGLLRKEGGVAARTRVLCENGRRGCVCRHDERIEHVRDRNVCRVVLLAMLKAVDAPIEVRGCSDLLESRRRLRVWLGIRKKMAMLLTHLRRAHLPTLTAWAGPTSI